MNGLYSILLFLFCFGAVTAGINQLGIFDYTLPTNGATLDNQTVKDLQSGAETTSLNPFNVISIGISFLSVMGHGVVAMFMVYFTVVDVFAMFGVDGTMAGVLATIVQAPLTFVALFGLFEWWTGRYVS
jgi:hypothetical protein